MLTQSIRSYGALFVMRKTIRLCWSQFRVGLRRLGIPLRHFASILEIVEALRATSIQCADANDALFVSRIQKYEIDLVVVAAFSQILEKQLIESAPLGCINVHPSLLPRYRGPNPIYWVLANGESVTGVTVHFIDEGVDTGDVILQQDIEIRLNDDERTLLMRSCALASDMIVTVVDSLASGSASRTPQCEEDSSYFSLPPKGASIL